MTNHNRTPQTTRKISPLAKALARVIVGSTLGVGTLFSCGMDFPIELLSDRKETLQGMPSGDFFFEAERLIAAKSENFPVAKNYPYQEPPELEDSEVEPELDGSLRSAETAGLSQAQLKQWRLARNTNSAEGVSALAPDLPKASQLYIAGALAFQQGDDVQARDYFQQAAELPERAGRAVHRAARECGSRRRRCRRPAPCERRRSTTDGRGPRGGGLRNPPV